MAEQSWPFYGAETNETQFSQWARTLGDSGIASGLALSAPGGMAVRVASGFGLVRGVYYNNDANKDLAVGAAPGTAGQTRLDAIVLRLDQTANTITAAVKAGTANTTGGALPALTQTETTYELLIGSVSVAQGVAAITSGMITELRPQIGNRVLVNTSARRPTAAQAPNALFFNTTTKQLEYSDGAAWSSLITVDVLSGTLSVAKGGTGVTTLKALRDALDIRVQPTDPGHKKGRVWINGPALD